MHFQLRDDILLSVAVGQFDFHAWHVRFIFCVKIFIRSSFLLKLIVLKSLLRYDMIL
jgi:hypothetical protein